MSSLSRDKSQDLIEEITFTGKNLWDAAAERREAELKATGRSKRLRIDDVRTIFLVGSKSSGKSTLICRLLEKTEAPRPTLALDFTFARRTTSDLTKEVCHIWELGGDAVTFSQLLETPIKTNHSLDKMSLIIVLDLSVPEKIWATLETVVSSAKRAVTRALAEGMNKAEALTMTQTLEDKIAQRLGEDVQDKLLLEPFPLPVAIIGTKYDIFQNFEPEKRKTICRILRLASHRLGASLNFYSKLDVPLNRRVRELLSHYAFETPFPKGICQDSSKPIMIPHGSDSYDQIWPNTSPNQFTMDFFKHVYESQVGKYNQKLAIPDDPADDANFREPEIDSMRNLMLEDISLTERVRKEYSNTVGNIII